MSLDALSFKYAGKNGCTLKFDQESRLLRITCDETILDVIDADDMIGARLEMEMKSNPSKKTVSDSLRDSNEPPTDILADHKGSMTLVLCVYPRRKVSWFGNRSNRPTPLYVRPNKPQGPRVAHHRRLLLEPSEDLGAAQTVTKRLNMIARGRHEEEPRRYWIIINPLSGPKKNAAMVAKTIVVPMLEEANVECTITTTTHARHAQMLVSKEENILEYDALVIMGGDGLIHEVLNGMREREDGLLQQLDQLPLGIIGCGTSNGLATSLTYAAGESSGIMQETFLIAKGKTIKADISSYQIGKKDASIVNYVSFLSFSWSMIADLDIDSECLRFLGESRYDVWGAYRTVLLRSHKAKLAYTMESDPDLKVTAPIPSSWTIIDADFVIFWVFHVSHAGKSTFASPKSTFGSGIFQLMIVRSPISRWKLAQILLGLENGSHEKLPGIEWIQCKQYRLVAADEVASYNDLDGELVVRGTVQAMIEPTHLTYFGSIASFEGRNA